MTYDTHTDITNECRFLSNLHGIVAVIADLWPNWARGEPPATTSLITYGDIIAMLHEKNAAYGDSALSPVRIFSRASPVEQLLVRIDDKLSRMARGHAAGEEIERDLIGYLVLLRIAEKRARS